LVEEAGAHAQRSRLFGGGGVGIHAAHGADPRTTRIWTPGTFRQWANGRRIRRASQLPHDFLELFTELVGGLKALAGRLAQRSQDGSIELWRDVALGEMRRRIGLLGGMRREQQQGALNV